MTTSTRVVVFFVFSFTNFDWILLCTSK